MRGFRKILLLALSCIAAVCAFTACGIFTTGNQVENSSESSGENSVENGIEGGVENGGETGNVHTHDYAHATVFKPTCTEKGYTLYACDCGDVKTDEEKPALGHNIGNCTLDKNGVTTGTCKRLACQKTITQTLAFTEIFKTEGSAILGWTESAVNLYTSLHLPAKVNGITITSIAASAFKETESLVELVIPDNYISIGGSAFYSCANLTSVELSSNLESIGAWAFFNSKKLTRITYPGTQDEWGNVAKGTNWSGVTAVGEVVCVNDNWRVLPQITVNGGTIDGSMDYDTDFVYNKTTDCFTESAGRNHCKGFYSLKATDDYILRVRMGANGGETAFSIYASESNYIEFRTGVDGHTNEVLFMRANGVWASETRFGYDLSTFVNLDGEGGMVDFTVVRYNQGFYVYVCDYIDEATGQTKKHETWKLIFSCTVNPDEAKSTMVTHNAWGHVITNGGVSGDLKKGIQTLVQASENVFELQNINSSGANWKIELDDIDSHAAAFVANPQKTTN